MPTILFYYPHRILDAEDIILLSLSYFRCRQYYFTIPIVFWMPRILFYYPHLILIILN